MIIGILCESLHDFNLFTILVKRSLVEVENVGKFIPYAAESSIIGKLDAASVTFFKKYLNNSEKADFAIYFSDTDRKPEKKSQILQWLKKHKEDHPERVIIPAFATPHFEQWFFSENDCLKAVMPNLPDELPFPEMIDGPKERLKKIEYKYTEMSLSSEEFRIKLVEKINLNSLKLRDPDFKAFSNELLTAVRQVQN